jgi:hypothetical protein
MILTSSNADSSAFRDLLNEHGVHLAIIYDKFFPNRIPVEWEKVGSMDLSRESVSVAEREAQFYATDAPTAATVRKELVAFKATLPPGVQITIH